MNLIWVACGFGLLLLQLSLLASSVAAETCTVEGGLRLADGATKNEGRVEVCLNGEWGTVCGHNWGASDAQVACRQLGMTSPSTYSDALYFYGGGAGLIHYAGFRCTGDETHLVNCSVDRQAPFEDTLCIHIEDAGVRCLSAPCTENAVRLNEEVVQVCHNEEWGLVCDHETSWGENGAEVVCNQLGMPSGHPRSLQRRLVFYDAPVIINNVQCTGLESSLLECSEAGFGDFNAGCEGIAVAQCEVSESCSDTNDIRLTQYTDDNLGRLEVCSGGIWGSVCGNGATNDIATVACRQLGHAAEGSVALESDVVGIFFPIVPITRTNMFCFGTESTIAECFFDGANGDPDCDHADDLIVVCTVRECNETDIRLVDGQTADDGRVEVCLDGQWGSVCDDLWDTRDAEVVCRQLGYNGPSYPLLSHNAPEEDALNFHLDNVQCSGNESTLSECDHLGIGFHNCIEAAEEAGVVCSNVPCIDGTVHLVNGDDISRGRVIYCYQGNWWSVCASDWGGEEARVVCNTLGYDTAVFDSLVSDFGRGTNPILSLSIHCSIDDNSLITCDTTPQDVTQCHQVAGVICIAPCDFVGITSCSVCETSSCVIDGICSCSSDCYEFGTCCSDIAHVEDCVVPECETGDIRLVGGVTNSAGRLEVCGDGMWGRVCNRLEFWGPDNARVVCRQLGFTEEGAYIVDEPSVFGTSERSAIVSEVNCVGTEVELLECSRGSIGRHTCGPTNPPVPDIAISCFDVNTSCEDGAVRLRDGTDPSNGRVEICQYRTWGAVCSEQWNDTDASIVCGQLDYNPEDARAMEGFGKDDTTPVFLAMVGCTGSETQLSMCLSSVPTGACTTAGVTCGRSSNAGRCADEAGTPPDGQNVVVDKERFGVCEAYGRDVTVAEVCNNVYQQGLDFIYISNDRGTQNDINSYLNAQVQSVSTIIATHDEVCVDQVFRVICHYYLPPCGTFTNPLPPSSLCEEECAHVQSTCAATWEAAAIVFDPFINCNDTPQLLFPLPNCCTGAGIELPESDQPTVSTMTDQPTVSRMIDQPTVSRMIDQPTVSTMTERRSSVSGGTVAGAVVGVLAFVALVVAAIVLVMWLVIQYKRVDKRKRLERIQLDILAMPGQNQPDTLNNVESHRNEGAIANGSREIEPAERNLLFGASIADPNPYSLPRPTTTAKTVSGSSLNVFENRTRVPSQYLRELTLGKFVVKSKNITLLECIGEGEFGIVYKARLRGSKGVAVKTLKGDFDQLEVDKFVEESLKMSRFKHSHVMGLLGVCLDAGSAPFIIMPYMANGSLLKYLKKERKNIVLSEEDDEDEVQSVSKRLMVMCSQIASGMEYLAAEKYIHRDLAARNCMIDAHFLIKITDFGLSEDVFVRNYFRQGSAGEVVKLPVKWMAPESLSDGHFSEKSDVWSYGVTMWEIFSGGKAPFPGTDPLTLMQRLEEGERIPKPYNAACIQEMYLMMRKCWQTAPKDRPTFKELYSNISKLIERIAGYLEMGFNPFEGGEEGKREVKKGELESPVAIEVIPASIYR